MELNGLLDGTTVAPLEHHTTIAFAKNQKKVFVCDNEENFTVTSYKLDVDEKVWKREKIFEENTTRITMLELSKNEQWVIATLLNGFKLWNVLDGRSQAIKLPKGMRNITKGFNISSSCILSRDDVYAVAGVRQELLIWDMNTGELIKSMTAHFQRIVEIKSLVVGTDNCVVTSSVDRSIKVWNLDYIFQSENHIDKHSLTIDSVSLSTKTRISVVVTRSCIGVWDFMTGRLKFTLSNSTLGAIITHALVTENGKYIVSAESGDVLYWNVAEKKVIYQEKQANIKQIFYYKNQTRCIVVSSSGEKGEFTGHCISRTVPEGATQYQINYPFKDFRSVVLTPGEVHIVCCGYEKQKDHLYVHSAKNGDFLHKILLKYDNFKEITKFVALPDKPSVVATIDIDKGNLIDIIQKRYLKSIPCWDGTCSHDGRYGLYAPPTGGMEMLDLRTGKVCNTLIPKVAEGIFDVFAVFNATNEYVLYYHSGRKTIRAFTRKNGQLIATFRVQADLKGMETTTDGRQESEIFFKNGFSFSLGVLC